MITTRRKYEFMPTRQSGRDAFTLTELMLVIAILSILLMIVAPNFSGQIERARRVLCRNNMRNIAMAFINDAEDTGGRVLIDRWVGGRWMWDIDFDTRKRLSETHGIRNRTLYCPSNMERYQEMVARGREHDEWWKYGDHTFSGYWLLIERGGSSSHPDFRFEGEGLVGRLSDAGPESVMIADATIASNGRFTNVVGSWGVPHRTAHMDLGGDLPAGTNLFFADGSAVWRPFDEMRRRLNMHPEHWW